MVPVVGRVLGNCVLRRESYFLSLYCWAHFEGDGVEKSPRWRLVALSYTAVLMCSALQPLRE